MNDILEHKDYIGEIIVGSIAAGLDTPKSDKDIICIKKPNIHKYFQVGKKKDNNIKVIFSKNTDYKIFEFENFCELLTDQSPHIVEALWTDERYHVISTPEWKELLDIREAFITSKLAYKYSSWIFSDIRTLRNSKVVFGEDKINKRPKMYSYCNFISSVTGNTIKLNFEDTALYTKSKIAENTYLIFSLRGNNAGLFDNSGQLNLLEAKKISNSDILRYIMVFDKKSYEKDVINWKKNVEEFNLRTLTDQRVQYDTKVAARILLLQYRLIILLNTGMIMVELPHTNKIIVKNVLEGTFKYEELITFITKNSSIIEEKFHNNNKIKKEIDLELIQNTINKIVGFNR